MDRPRLEVADVFRRRGPAYRRAHRLSGEQRRVMRAAWLEERKSELLPVEYFHVVLTLPAALNELAWQNQRALYTLLFRAAAQALETIAADPKHWGAQIGFLAALHTWGRGALWALLLHPPLHCRVPGGGLAPDRTRWIACRPGFFLPAPVLSRLFRRLFLEGLEALFRKGRLQLAGALKPLADPDAFARLLAQLGAAEWDLYAKRPFAGPAQVLTGSSASATTACCGPATVAPNWRFAGGCWPRPIRLRRPNRPPTRSATRN